MKYWSLYRRLVASYLILYLRLVSENETAVVLDQLVVLVECDESSLRAF